jgi:C4-dicarboxylate transporter DctQ subunit
MEHKNSVTFWIIKINEVLAMTSIVLLTVSALLQVFFRFVLKISVPWTEEFARLAYIWVIFIGLILVEADDNQIKTIYFLEKLPKKANVAARIIINIFCIIFEVCLFVGAIAMFKASATRHFGSITFLPVSAMYVPLIISAPLVILFLARQIVCRYRSLGTLR